MDTEPRTEPGFWEAPRPASSSRTLLPIAWTRKQRGLALAPGGCLEGTPSSPLTPRDILMAREQVTPDFPHTTFSVRILKVGWESLVPQPSCGEGALRRSPQEPSCPPRAAPRPPWSLPPGLTVAKMYSQLPSNTKRCPSKVTTWPSP